jgi:hypothetical protein
MKLIFLFVFLMVLNAGSAFSEATNGIWCFNFAPLGAPGAKNFIQITGDSVYDPKKGYGWLNIKGETEKGAWPSDDGALWESRENLNLVARIGPDDLARSYACGPAVFAIDLKPGKYEIWVLSGDWGLREHIPFEPYQIFVEGLKVLDFKPRADEFYPAYEAPDLKDDLTQDGVWRRHVEPRFRWIKTLIDLKDGQLNIHVDGPQRDMKILDFMGDYAIAEIREGPPKRFAGALNALVVLAADKNRSGHKTIEEIDAWRKENFSKKWPLTTSAKSRSVKFSADDDQRGYTVFFPNPIEPAGPYDRLPHEEKIIRLRATPGEYVPITFGICPLRNLGNTKAIFDSLYLRSEGKGIVWQTGDQLASGVIKYVARPSGQVKNSWHPAPTLIVPTDTWDIKAGVTKQFWFTLHVPDETRPGVYRGTIGIFPENAEKCAVQVELEVLPFKLDRPTHLSVGMTYFSPVHYAYFGEDRFWKRIKAEFDDMRAHNMTCVQYTGLRMDDFPRLTRAFNIYRAAGFENPVYLLESYGAMGRLQREGIAWDTEEFHRKYVQFIREFLAEGERRNWPPVVINFGDEFTNKAIEEFGARVAKNLKTIPGIVTGADTDGYKEVSLMAPLVDIVAFNDGWDGPYGVNRGRNLLKRETVEQIKRAGATPWLVNVGVDRYSNGFWLWKLVQWGVRGKIEWIYRNYSGMPHNSFDANPMSAHIAYPGPQGTAIPSLDYEWMRMGLDDLAYLYTLEKTIEAFRDREEKKDAVSAADGFLRRLSDSLEEDMSNYGDRKSISSIAWPADKIDAMRNQLIDFILKLQ